MQRGGHGKGSLKIKGFLFSIITFCLFSIQGCRTCCCLLGLPPYSSCKERPIYYKKDTTPISGEKSVSKRGITNNGTKVSVN